ncbi:MAG: riboflavin synthase [Actinobacteria bacterium]|nr:riboflavin synthase [Actinomycetota bacterium]
MFTGIIAELGEVESVASSAEGARVRIRTGLTSELTPGDSIAVNGACLTAAEAADGSFSADVMNQTLELTTLGGLGEGDPVNLELALRASDRLGGHVVQGHVDGTGSVVATRPDGIARRLRVSLPGELLPLVVERGSVAVEGVSLTVAALGEDWVEVSLIPETLERTTLGAREPGDRVNVECDVLARYVQRMTSGLSPLRGERS